MIRAILQPYSDCTLDVLCAVARRQEMRSLDIAVAYITGSGLRDMLFEMRSALGAGWDVVPKRWLTSFDYLRTEPTALGLVLSLPKSTVRIRDGARLLKRGCVPTTPFHPKVFVGKGKRGDWVLAGSGNLSRSGLRRGVEAGFVVETSAARRAGDAAARLSIKQYRGWFKDLWNQADQCSDLLLRDYATLYESRENLIYPTPTDDDLYPVNSGPNQLSSADLIKLRACKHLWIDAGNITQNLGKGLPGNQLMMKRLSRVFFGVPAIDVPQNSPLTRVEVKFDGKRPYECSLTFSDNGMDKLTLPLPETFGPAAYDNETLLFTKIRPGYFELSIGRVAERAAWRKRSKVIGGDFKLQGSPRAWGVF